MNEKSQRLKELINLEKRIIGEMKLFFRELHGSKNSEETKIATSEIQELKAYLKKTNLKLGELLGETSLIRPMEKNTEVSVSKEDIKRIGKVSKQNSGEMKFSGKANLDEFELSDLEKVTLRRLKQKEKKEEVKSIRKPSSYLKFSNKIFFNVSNDLIKEHFFKTMKWDIVKSNLEILPRTYLSMTFLTTLISFIISVVVVVFFLFFNFGVQVPFITKSTDEILPRLAKIFWMLIVFPLLTFVFLYFYPTLEKKGNQAKIDQEIPFATIHMSAVSGSMVDPTRIFNILVITGDYPNISKQFVKLLNQINLQGYSLVSALRLTAFNGPSAKLSELLNGLATTITSGGDLPGFFEKRAESLMLDYRLEKEKYAKTAETFMDIYISVVIAAPMILMLLLIMMQISGIGVGLSSNMISLVMSLGVSLINFAFLIFLHIRSATVGE